MSNLAENLEDLTYQMSDSELIELGTKVFENNLEQHGITDLSKVSMEESEIISDCIQTLPYTRDEIDSLVKLGFYPREELEAENRRLYAERKWEQYL